MEKFIIFVLIFEFTFSQNIYNAAEYITKNSHKKSKQACAKYVANALIYGGGFKFERQGSAYMYHSKGILKQIGYYEIPKPSTFKIGDITVTEKNFKHEHGHIALWNGNQWISDFKQKSEFVYSIAQPTVHYYRYGEEEISDNSKFSISQEGINLIKSFEGCELKAYYDKLGRVWTIGYGHTGKDVYEGLTITQEQADNLLKKDLAKFENFVKNPKYVSIQLTQNQFDALVSFSYNCGQKNLKDLCYGKSASQIANEIILYNKSSGKVVNGLVRRRKAEQALFLKQSGPVPEIIPKPIEPIKKNVIFTYAVRISGGKILPEVENDNDYAGKIGNKITDIAIKVNVGSIKYRVHVKGGKWLKFVSGYNWNDPKNGYAGNKKPIDLIQIIYNGDNNSPKYRVSPLNKKYYAWQLGNKVGKGYDGYAGALGKVIDRIQIIPS